VSLRTPAQHGSQTSELEDELEQISELRLSEQLKELDTSHSDEDQLSELNSQLEELEENSVQLEEELEGQDSVELEQEGSMVQLDELDELGQ
jgi:hypothetical protein